MAPSINDHEWRRTGQSGDYIVSSAAKLVDRGFIKRAFESPDTYWAWPLSEEDMSTMLANSTVLGLYKILPTVPEAKSADAPSSPRTPSPTVEDNENEKLQQIGMARIVTDHITTAYLTDVYIEQQYRTDGLGKWLIFCCNEIFDSLPAMRRTWLMTSPVVGKRFYTRELGMWDVGEEKDSAVCMTRRYYNMD